MCLTCIFDKSHAVRTRDVEEGLRERAAIEVDRENRPRSVGDMFLDQARVEIEGIEVDIDQNGASSRSDDGRGGGHRTERSRYHFVARLNSGSYKSKSEGVSSRTHTDSLASPAVSGKLFFEGEDLRSENELSATDDTVDGGIHAGSDLGPLPSQVSEGNGCFSGSKR